MPAGFGDGEGLLGKEAGTVWMGAGTPWHVLGTLLAWRCGSTGQDWEFLRDVLKMVV